jgi:hypothetical protein
MDKQKNGMVSRRGFLERTLAVSAAAASVNGSVLAAMIRGPQESENRSTALGLTRLRAFVVDAVLSAGPAFGTVAARAGLPVRVIRSDPGGFWMHELEPAWRRAPSAIAGFTSAPTLFCLQMLARTYGLDLVHCAAHDPATPDAGRAWIEAAVGAAVSMSREPSALAPIDPGEPRARASAIAFSWVIAKRRRAQSCPAHRPV